nr:hypothetical protein CFP56_74594 [Quercus suber]
MALRNPQGFPGDAPVGSRLHIPVGRILRWELQLDEVAQSRHTNIDLCLIPEVFLQPESSTIALPTMVFTTTLASFLPVFVLLTPAFGDTVSTPQACSADSVTVNSDNGNGIWPYLSYQSTNLTPPLFQVNQTNKALSPGLIFYADVDSSSTPGEKQQYPLISTDQGDLVWAGPAAATNNFKMQQLKGKPVISYWIGTGTAGANGQAGHGYGQVEVLDTNYKKIFTVCPNIDITLPPGTTANCVADIHESYITESNTILVTAYNITQADLRPVGGPKNGWVLDPLAVEVDLNTNEALFIWSPLAHVSVTASRLPLNGAGTSPSNPYDFFHTNSIQSFNGKFLINSRHTWSAYYVDRSGDIEWMINGDDGGDFGPLPKGSQFSWQHHVRLFNQSGSTDQVLLTQFADNNFAPNTNNVSLGLSFLLDLPPKKSQSPTLVTRIVDKNDRVISYAEGSYQMLDNDNIFLGYGIRPILKEFGGNGDIRWTAQFGDLNTGSSYRAFKQAWHATPTTALSLVVQSAASNDALNSCAAGSSFRGFVSWNGATDVGKYRLSTGSKRTNLQVAATVARKGFETEFVVPQDANFIQVAALDMNGNVSGKSAIVAVQ